MMRLSKSLCNVCGNESHIAGDGICRKNGELTAAKNAPCEKNKGVDSPRKPITLDDMRSSNTTNTYASRGRELLAKCYEAASITPHRPTESAIRAKTLIKIDEQTISKIRKSWPYNWTDSKDFLCNEKTKGT